MDMKATDLKPGDKVFYLGDIEATVVRVARNGVFIEYFGFGHKRDQRQRERVTAKQLKPREDLYA
jgi:hypothetical protein